MPENNVLEQKKKLVEELVKRLEGANSGVIVSYKGINVADDTKLRKDLRDADVEYSVVKNTMLRRATEKIGMEAINEILVGSTALATSEDHTAPARILCEFADKSQTFEIKAGFIDGEIIDIQTVEQLAKMPSKEELVAKVVGGLNAPISGLVYVLNANITGLARVLGAIAEQKA